MQNEQSAASMWTEYRDTEVVRRAEHYAKYTIPSLMVDPLLSQADSNVYHDFQSIGALLTNNLSSKLASLLFPTGQPFFKNRETDSLRQAAEDNGISDSQLKEKLSTLEIKATERLVSNASFAKLTQLVQLLVVTGQALLYRDTDESKFRVWNLQSFSVKRNGHGDWKCIVLKQRIAFEDIPYQIRNDAESKLPGRFKADASVDFYTVVKRVEDEHGRKRVVVYNELDNTRVGPESSYPEHLSPYLLPVWKLSDGENYARGMVEEYSGDFARLSLVSEQLGLYEIDSLHVLNLVNEAAGGVVDDFKESEPGDYIPGNADAVKAYERGDYQKMQAIRQAIGEVTARLSVAFMYTGNTRDAERVTAEEIRTLANEAENTLGGVYSILAESLQAPLAYLMMSEVSKDLLPGLINKSYVPEIMTGMHALNRSLAVQNLLAASQEAAATVPALMELDQRLDPEKLMDLFYRNHSVDIADLKKSADQLRQEAAQQEAAAAQQSDMAQAGPALQESISQLR